jgi:hypothetical protein
VIGRRYNSVPRDLEGHFVRMLEEGKWVDNDAVLMTLANRIGKGLDRGSAVSASRLMIDRALAYGFIERRQKDGCIRLLPEAKRNEIRASFTFKKPAPTLVTFDDKNTGETFTCVAGSDEERRLREQIRENADALYYAGLERARRAYEKNHPQHA